MALDFKSELAHLEVESVAKLDADRFQREKDMRWMSSHVEDGGMIRCLANIREEAAREKEFQERTDHAALVNKRASDENALCSEINKIRQEKLTEEYRRQRLRDNDPELQDLMRRLRASYVCRDRKQQILHNEYRRLQEKREAEQANRQLQASLYSSQQHEATESQLEYQRKTEYRQQLQRQIVDSSRRRQCVYEDTLKEKQVLDDVMRTIYVEDMRELQLKQEKAEQIRREQKMHTAAQQAWRDKHKQFILQEERRIEKQAAETPNREQAVVAERKRKLEIKEAVNKRVVSMILDEEAKKEERSDVIMCLQEQECLERHVNESLAELDKLARNKRDNKLSLTMQMEQHRQQVARDRECDRRFRLDIENQARTQDEKERERARQKREKQLQYKRDLKQQIEANEIKRQKERQIEEERAKYVRDFNSDIARQVAAERSILISTHAAHLLGCLQPGTIQTSDLTTVLGGAASHPELAASHPELARLDIESMARTKTKCNTHCQRLREF